MSDSPWNAYGRLPLDATNASRAERDVLLESVMKEALRGRAQLEKYLSAVVREYFEIQSGRTGYRSIIDGALAPSTRPESIEERLNRLAQEALSRRPKGGAAKRRPRAP